MHDRRQGESCKYQQAGECHQEHHRESGQEWTSSTRSNTAAHNVKFFSVEGAQLLDHHEFTVVGGLGTLPKTFAKTRNPQAWTALYVKLGGAPCTPLQQGGQGSGYGICLRGDFTKTCPTDLVTRVAVPAPIDLLWGDKKQRGAAPEYRRTYIEDPIVVRGNVVGPHTIDTTRVSRECRYRNKLTSSTKSSYLSSTGTK